MPKPSGHAAVRTTVRTGQWRGHEDDPSKQFREFDGLAMIAAPDLNPGFLFFKIRVKLLALIRLHAMGEVGQFYDTLLTYISFVACVVLCAYPRLLLRTGQICTQHGSDRIRMRQQLSGGGRGLGPMSSKQLGEFIDQKALHGYGDLPGHVAAPSQHSKPTERALSH